METRQLIAFTTVVQTGSFTKAAAILKCSQPTITTRIRNLEETLGVTLFRRLPHGVQMTSAGVELLPFAHNIITLTDRARKAITINGEPDGRLVIGTIGSLTAYRLLPLVEYMCWRHPGVRIRLQTGDTAHHLDAVRDGRMECAFLIAPVEPYAGLETAVLCPEPLALLTAPTHPLARRSTVTDDDLRDLTVIRAENGATYHERFERALGLSERGSRSAVLALDSIDAAKQAVAAGLGVALLPEVTVAAEIEEGRLRRLPWVVPFRVHTQVVWRPDAPTNAAVTALVSAAARVVSEQVAHRT